MNIIAVDIGNSSTKLSHIAQRSLFQLDPLFEDAPIDTGADSNCWSIVSVNPAKTEQLVTWIKRHHPSDKISLIDNQQIPLLSAVQDRAALGTDRLMAAWAATCLNERATGESSPCVIVDAGTAVTIDLVDVVDGDPVFRGGLIFPGIPASLAALSKNTAALPDLSRSSRFDLKLDLEAGNNLIQIGDDTSSAIRSGVVQSQIWAILGIASQLAAQHQATVYCTGGGLLEVQPILPKTWHWVHDLIHQGIRFLADVSDKPQSENP